ncbi:hypothetical protein [Spirosoma sp. 209]|nr:hypothetical protein [Spirosoma sp. 209]
MTTQTVLAEIVAISKDLEKPELAYQHDALLAQLSALNEYIGAKRLVQ